MSIFVRLFAGRNRVNALAKDSDTKELTAKEAKRTEELFIGRCRENLQALHEIPNPLSGASVRHQFAEEYYEPHTLRRQIKEIMEENEIYDKPLLERVPRGRYFYFTVYEHGLFDKKPSVVISAYVNCEFADFVKEGKSSTPTSASEVESVRLGAMKESELFHYIALLGLCGFEKAALSLPLSGPNWEMALVTHAGGTAWKMVSGEPSRRNTMLALFDPEKKSEKLWRAKSIITGSSELTVSGGFIILSDVVEQSGLSPEIVKKAAEDFCARDKSISIERVEGKLIVKHSRL